MPLSLREPTCERIPMIGSVDSTNRRHFDAIDLLIFVHGFFMLVFDQEVSAILPSELVRQYKGFFPDDLIWSFLQNSHEELLQFRVICKRYCMRGFQRMHDNCYHQTPLSYTAEEKQITTINGYDLADISSAASLASDDHLDVSTSAQHGIF